MSKFVLYNTEIPRILRSGDLLQRSITMLELLWYYHDVSTLYVTVFFMQYLYKLASVAMYKGNPFYGVVSLWKGW